MRELPTHTDRNLRELCRLPRGASLLVAVSGGADSVALLHALALASPRTPWRLRVAHFNHRLRGAEADADAAFVGAEAARLSLPFHGGVAESRRPLDAGRESVEMAARRLRHAFLARTAREAGVDAVVLAHHADDQAELFLMRLLRGSGGAGLGGMRWDAPSPADPGVRLCRPLLDVRRDALRAFLSARGLAFREDASNRDTAFERNAVRHQLLPFLRGFAGADIDTVLVRVAELTAADADFVAMAAAAWRPGAEPFEALHPAVQRAVVREQLWRLGHDPAFELVERLRLRPSRRATGPGRRTLRRDGDAVVEVPGTGGFVAGERAVGLDRRPARLRWHGVEVRWRIAAGAGAAGLPAPRPGREVFDCDRVGTGVVLRHWRPGDRFRPLGFPSAAKLQDLFVNRRVPAAERRHRLVAVDGAGTVFWVEGLPPGHDVRITSRTRRVLEWTWRRTAPQG